MVGIGDIRAELEVALNGQCEITVNMAAVCEHFEVGRAAVMKAVEIRTGLPLFAEDQKRVPELVRKALGSADEAVRIVNQTDSIAEGSTNQLLGILGVSDNGHAQQAIGKAAVQVTNLYAIKDQGDGAMDRLEAATGDVDTATLTDIAGQFVRADDAAHTTRQTSIEVLGHVNGYLTAIGGAVIEWPYSTHTEQAVAH